MYSSVASGKHDKDISREAEKLEGPYAPPPPLSVLAAQTKFTYNELRYLYKAFKNACHSGIATKETFCTAFDCIFHDAASHGYAILTFNAFDRYSRGYISFADFAQTLSGLLHGTREEILNWVFDLYDFDKDGYISRHELANTIRAIQDLLGPWQAAGETIDNIENKTNWMLNKFDVDRDGRIGRPEFISVCCQDQVILESLTAFGSSL